MGKPIIRTTKEVSTQQTRLLGNAESPSAETKLASLKPLDAKKSEFENTDQSIACNCASNSNSNIKYV